MKRFPDAGIAVIAMCVGTALAQQPSPHIGYLYPAGAREGSTIQIRAGGQFLNGTSKVYVSGTGVDAKVIEYVKPLSGAEAQKARDEFQQLNQKKANRKNGAWTEEDERTLTALRETLEDVARRPSIPAIAEIVLLEVTVAADAARGPHEMRFETQFGLTNTVRFLVGELPEFARKPARVRPAFNVVNGATPPLRAAPISPEEPMDIALPAAVNGQMMPAAVDRYRFRAARGQRLVIEAAARELMPYLSDAVPGWFQAVLTLRNAAGKELASADHYLFHPDPVLLYEVAEDGEYTVEIHDSIYRGREDFVYRITMGELPFIGSIFPLGGTAGHTSMIELRGWNIPSARLAQDSKRRSPGVYPVSVHNHATASNTFAFAVDTLPETTAKDGIHRREKAQKVKLPQIVNGRIERAGEPDFFRFDARAGDEVVAEVYARRLGSPLDSVLRISDAAGKELAANDDFEDKGAGLITHQADSRILFRAPSKGTYYIQLGDAQRKGGPEYAYRMRVSHPRPDFELRVAPATLSLRAGSTAAVTVYALRKDGFAGEIALALKDAPAGFTLAGAMIPSGEDKIRLTLTAPRGPVSAPVSLEIEGQAAVNGSQVRHTAVAAQDMMQAFAYHHLVPEEAWLVRVIGSGFGPAWRASNEIVRLPAGGTAPLTIFVPPRLLQGVQVALNDPPDGISIQSAAPSRDGLSLLLRIDPKKAKPGLRGNLILDAFREVTSKNAAGAQSRRKQPLGMLPAIAFEIVDNRQARK